MFVHEEIYSGEEVSDTDYLDANHQFRVMVAHCSVNATGYIKVYQEGNPSNLLTFQSIYFGCPEYLYFTTPAGIPIKWKMITANNSSLENQRIDVIWQKP